MQLIGKIHLFLLIMKKLTKENIPGGYSYAAVDSDGFAHAYKSKPYLSSSDDIDWSCNGEFYKLGWGWDASSWRYSLVSNEAENQQAQKDQANKPSFAEIDPDFLLAMADRMTANKGKYEPFNWHKPCDINLLLDAAQRHLLALRMPERERAEETHLDHAVALALNAMIIHYQLRHNERTPKQP